MNQSLNTKFTRGSSVFHNTMRNKQVQTVEFNPYIYLVYSLSKLCRFSDEIFVFQHTLGRYSEQPLEPSAHTSRKRFHRRMVANFSYVHSSRKHWKCKYLAIP